MSSRSLEASSLKARSQQGRHPSEGPEGKCLHLFPDFGWPPPVLAFSGSQQHHSAPCPSSHGLLPCVYLRVSSLPLIRSRVVFNQGPTLLQHALILTNYISNNPISEVLGLGTLAYLLRPHNSSRNSFLMPGARTRPPCLVLTLSLWSSSVALYPLRVTAPRIICRLCFFQYIHARRHSPEILMWQIQAGKQPFPTIKLKGKVS